MSFLAHLEIDRSYEVLLELFKLEQARPLWFLSQLPPKPQTLESW